MGKTGYQRLFYFVVNIILFVVLYKIKKNSKKNQIQILKNKENNTEDNKKTNNI